MRSSSTVGIYAMEPVNVTSNTLVFGKCASEDIGYAHFQTTLFSVIKRFVPKSESFRIFSYYIGRAIAKSMEGWWNAVFRALFQRCILTKSQAVSQRLSCSWLCNCFSIFIAWRKYFFLYTIVYTICTIGSWQLCLKAEIIVCNTFHLRSVCRTCVSCLNSLGFSIYFE